MFDFPWRGAVAVGLIAVAAVFVSKCYHDRSSAWEQRARAVLAQATVLDSVAEARKRAAERHRRRADSLAEQAEQVAPEIRERIDTVRVQTPDSLADVLAVVQRDSIIEDLKVESRRWRLAFEAERDRAEALEGALATAEARADSALDVLEDRPGDRPWWVPRLGVGPAMGVGTDGDAYVGAGINLSWEIRL